MTAVDGRSTRWEDHRAARRAQLVHAARKAVHRIGPGASMDEIAAEARTSKSIVYRYFEDKAGLRLAVASTVVATMHDALQQAAAAAPTPLAALRAMVRVYLEMIERSPNVYWFVTRTTIGGIDPATDVVSPAEAPLGAYLDSVIELVAEPFARATDVPHDTAAAWAAGAVGFVRGAGEWWLSHQSPDAGGTALGPTREEPTEQVTLWLWNGPVGVLHSRGDHDHQISKQPAGPTRSDRHGSMQETR